MEGGKFRKDDPSTPDVNEAFVQPGEEEAKPSKPEPEATGRDPNKNYFRYGKVSIVTAKTTK